MTDDKLPDGGQEASQPIDNAANDIPADEKSFSATRRDVLTSSLAALGMSAGITRAKAASKDGSVETVSAGHLQCKLKDTNDGVHLQSLHDELGGRELLAERPGPLWKIAMYDPDTNYTRDRRGVLRADQGWEETTITRHDGSVEMTWNTGTAEIIESPVSVYEIPNKTLTVDGDVSELTDTASLDLSEDFTVFNGTYTKDGTVWLTWDTDSLYVAADLQDNDHVQTYDGGQTWRDDCLQVGVSAGKPGTTSEWDQLDIALTSDGPQVYRRVLPGKTVSQVMASANANIVRENDYTRYEVELPWDDLTATTSDEFVSVSLAVHDRDENGNTGWLEWGGGILGGKSNGEFRLATLSSDGDGGFSGGQDGSSNETKDEQLLNLTVTARVKPNPSNDSLHWNLDVANDSEWSVEQVAFPQAGLREMDEGKLFFPTDEGRVVSNPWQQSESGTSPGSNEDGFDTFELNYPGHFDGLQYFSVYEPGATGLYVSHHDPKANVKTGTIKTPSEPEGLRLRFRQPTPDMIVAGNDFTLDGESVWQLYEGDWYDAAMIYRDWAQQQEWYPALGADGRTNTPGWMREGVIWLTLWTHGGADLIRKRVEMVKEFAEFMDVPVGVHWYVWFWSSHDDNYPNYPPRPAFEEGVKELQDAGIRVMPYINTRLWDVGLNSFDTTGRAGACKSPSGNPYMATGKFAVMDPSTDLWKDKIRNIVLRLFNKFGVDSVYLDQLGGPAYAGDRRPEFGGPLALCCDPDHDHPLGGGHWWTDGYREMLKSIRAKMPAGKALTCEHAPEMYADQLDATLTWTWGQRYSFGQENSSQSVSDVVPAIPAVYGGAVQMFGHDWGGQFTGVSPPEQRKEHAPWLRMVAAKQLTYGIQLGWWNTNEYLLSVKPLMRYMRRIGKLRYEVTRYFYAGRMVRPPSVDVPTPTINAPTKGGYRITPDAILTSAWKRQDENTILLLFANWTDDTVITDVAIDLKQYDMEGRVNVQRIEPDGATNDEFTTARQIEREVTFAPKTAWAWEVTLETH